MTSSKSKSVKKRAGDMPVCVEDKKTIKPKKGKDVEEGEVLEVSSTPPKNDDSEKKKTYMTKLNN